MKNIFNYIVVGIIIVLTVTSCSRKKDKFLNRAWHSVNTKYNVLYNGNVALESGRGSTLGNVHSNEDARPCTLELPTWVDEETNDWLYDEDVGSPSHKQKHHHKSVKSVQSVHSVDSNGYNDDDDDEISVDDERKKDTPTLLKRLNPAYNNADLIARESRGMLNADARKQRSTLFASTMHSKSTKNVLAWKSGRRKWHSILELAKITLYKPKPIQRLSQRRPSTHTALLQGSSVQHYTGLSRDPMADCDAVLLTSAEREKRSDKQDGGRVPQYRQCLVSTVSEDEVVPHEKIADVACRIVEAGLLKKEGANKETTLSGMLQKKISFYRTAEARAA